MWNDSSYGFLAVTTIWGPCWKAAYGMCQRQVLPLQAGGQWSKSALLADRSVNCH